jgi:hypothetical protein
VVAWETGLGLDLGRAITLWVTVRVTVCVSTVTV